MTRRLFGNATLLKELIDRYHVDAGKSEEDGGEPTRKVTPLGDVGFVGREGLVERSLVATRGVATAEVGDRTFQSMLPAIQKGSSWRESLPPSKNGAPMAEPDLAGRPTPYSLSSVHMNLPLRLADQNAGVHLPPMPAVTQSRSVALAGLRRRLADVGLEGCGEGIGIIVVDEGYNERHLVASTAAETSTFGGGWQFFAQNPDAAVGNVGEFHDPYRRQADGHGNMIARNLIDLAPKAKLFDAPILPPRVTKLDAFSSTAAAVLNAIATILADPAAYGIGTLDRWIVVNAWGVADRFADPAWSTGQDPSYVANRTHALNEAVSAVADVADVVFAAGNSGEHDPAPLSGPYDRGPHRSIWGANGLSEVVTVGATTLCRQVVSAASQGPSEPALMEGHDPTSPGVNVKSGPYAPSWFSEDDDASVVNTGTSAAAAVHAGCLAIRHSSKGCKAKTASTA